MNSSVDSNASLPIPSYVLLNEKTRVSPTVKPRQSGQQCIALYGFSDKIPYDLFRTSSQLLLTPFPLVKGTLQTLIETRPNDLHLVILDARGPDDPQVYATTMETVLEAQKTQSATIAIEFSLEFDEESNSYRVVEPA